MITQAQFLKFLQDIEPSYTTKNNASSSHSRLREFLNKHPEFGQYILTTFLSGSYKRDTAIRPQTKKGNTERPDIDIIVVTIHTINDSPAAVVELLYIILKTEYENIRRQARSIGIQAPLADMDVVPIIAPYGLENTLYIPDRKLEKWLVTNPPGHTVWTTQVNKASNGNFKPLVKLMKWWRRNNRTISKHPKGFVIESIVAECMNYQENQYADLFLGTLEAIVSRYAIDIACGRVPLIQDPAVPGNYVTTQITFDAFKGFYNKVKDHAELGRLAQAEKDPVKSLTMWREIFDIRFPSSETANFSGLLETPARPEGGMTFPDRPIVPTNKPRGFA
ncbi:hypothetical protein Riv7116_4987 [Rivularia sp. PCC 7116]|uniref:SMODS domain-containing nucleotidyltransferase n=1 Tax=Rivularia sp. PCC 7116 TaxID=373994 RepID=UPI00029F1424|nr:nucleotidyltransferase [Rivularia sp. PCC 7116]AFY57393.1 hypothetical protein Riv7116_4987 [Rivularia sp. PCC 7116]